MSAVTTTSLLLPQYSGHFNAEVIGADPTATTFILNCNYDKYTTSEDCYVTSQTFVVGPWADKTLSSGAPATGVFRKIYAEEPDGDYGGFSYSAQCEMSRTYASICTTVNIGGNAYFGETATFPRSTGTDYDGFYRMAGYGDFRWVPVTITKGQKYLAAAAEATPTSDSEEDREATSTTSDVVVITDEADSTEATSNGVRARRGLSLWGVIGLVVLVACL
ncbi:uncharacterized protein B0J16DRAFT_183037 [Fusarium flagelliforme]|uniref:uncharacterized protein n=1 Tax=Fusarium flagelliforme TaxID=2675880 RepID=UPI001E8CBB92|nr:uncharacterized protein B0J16DRAFT_183037 [Fusarium flagelliforme]KAH7174560.1 hypothetical protein B0J16DRAFT_183037 [Fusarium flagelliforme]